MGGPRGWYECCGEEAILFCRKSKNDFSIVVAWVRTIDQIAVVTQLTGFFASCKTHNTINIVTNMTVISTDDTDNEFLC